MKIPLIHRSILWPYIPLYDSVLVREFDSWPKESTLRIKFLALVCWDIPIRLPFWIGRGWATLISLLFRLL